MKLDWNEMVWAIAGVAALVVLAQSCSKRTADFQVSMRACMEKHPALECEKAVHW